MAKYYQTLRQEVVFVNAIQQAGCYQTLNWDYKVLEWKIVFDDEMLQAS